MNTFDFLCYYIHITRSGQICSPLLVQGDGQYCNVVLLCESLGTCSYWYGGPQHLHYYRLRRNCVCVCVGDSGAAKQQIFFFKCKLCKLHLLYCTDGHNIHKKHMQPAMTHLFCGENRKTDQSSRVSHQSGLYASNIFWTRKHKLCKYIHASGTQGNHTVFLCNRHKIDTVLPRERSHLVSPLKLFTKVKHCYGKCLEHL